MILKFSSKHTSGLRTHLFVQLSIYLITYYLLYTRYCVEHCGNRDENDKTLFQRACMKCLMVCTGCCGKEEERVLWLAEGSEVGEDSSVSLETWIGVLQNKEEANELIHSKAQSGTKYKMYREPDEVHCVTE